MTSEQTLFAFQVGADSPDWKCVNDGVMGGVSTSDFRLLPGGGAVFGGIVSLDNDGGFASVRSPPVERNLSDFDSFALRIRGDQHRFKFNVRTESGLDTPIYQCAFETKRDEWEERRLAFKQFVPTFRGRVLGNVPPLNPSRVASVGFLIAGKQDGPFRLEIAWIKARGSADD